MTTAIIGIGSSGGTLGRELVAGGERVVLAAREESGAAGLARELGEPASAAPVEDAIEAADVVVFAVWLDTLKELIAEHAGLLAGKVVVDPSNPIGFGENGQPFRTLPGNQSAGSVVAALLPRGGRYVKAFGSLSADSLANESNRQPRRAVLFYASDDDSAGAAVERLITAAGFDPVKIGGLADAGRIEVPGGDLHQHGGLNGQVLDLDQARAAIAQVAAAS
jgi:8-hydroxy-5-deazaflavin:NADPH oxidoreductase